jgi:hypothetical protein
LADSRTFSAPILESSMSRKAEKRPMTDDQISIQESRIPDIALKAFSNAYKMALANGAAVLVAKDGQLFEVTEKSSVVLRTIGTYGNLKSGTRLHINKSSKQVNS